MALLVVPGAALANERLTVSYPEHGKIISSRTVKRVYRLDPTRQGPHHADIVICRIGTADRVYELKGPAVGSPVGQDVSFRVKKGHVYIAVGKEERKYEITALGDKPRL